MNAINSKRSRGRSTNSLAVGAEGGRRPTYRTSASRERKGRPKADLKEAKGPLTERALASEEREAEGRLTVRAPASEEREAEGRLKGDS